MNVNKIRVLLAIEPRVLRETLAETLGREADVEVVGLATDPVDLLLAVTETEAQVVIHSLPEPAEMPQVCTHLLSEFPELLVLAISADAGRAFAYRQEITTTPVSAGTARDVLAAIRGATSST